MNRRNVFAFVGNATIDLFLDGAELSRSGRFLVLRCAEGECLVRCEGSIGPGAKVTVDRLPELLVTAATKQSFGGGGPNSLLASLMVTPDLEAAYLDMCCADEGLQEVFRARGVAIRSL